MSSSEAYQELWLRLHDLEIEEVNGVFIPLSPSWKKICVNLSGGADSALLMSLLCAIIQERGYNTKVDAITFDRFWFSKPWLKPISEHVFSRVKSMFPNTVDKHHISFLAPELEDCRVNLEGSLETRSAFTMAAYSFSDYHCFYDQDVGAVFHGRSKNASTLLDHPHRVKRRDNPGPEEMLEKLKRSEAYIIRPLLFVEKDWIIDQFKKNNWDELLKITRSCGSNIENLKKSWKFKAESPPPECGECYWCLERKWAIDKVV